MSRHNAVSTQMGHFGLLFYVLSLDTGVCHTDVNVKCHTKNATKYVDINICSHWKLSWTIRTATMYETSSLVTSWCGNQVIYQGGDVGNTSLAPHMHVLCLVMLLMWVDHRRALLLFIYFIFCRAAWCITLTRHNYTNGNNYGITYMRSA